MKFSAGDRVTALHDCPSPFLKPGEFGIIDGNNSSGFWDVSPVRHPGIGVSIHEMYLEKFSNNYKLNPFLEFLPDGGRNDAPTIVFSEHSCTWKTYTGLSYKEEYCDCGKTKNKRGIFE